MDIYKTREFSRLAGKARLTDAELLASAKRAEKGLADAEIGKFLIKQRVPRRGRGRAGGFRAILFHRQGDKAVFLHLFAKNERGNLSSTEEDAYRVIAKAMAKLSRSAIEELIERQMWIRIEDDEISDQVSE
jgi:hypothetical protein